MATATKAKRTTTTKKTTRSPRAKTATKATVARKAPTKTTRTAPIRKAAARKTSKSVAKKASNSGDAATTALIVEVGAIALALMFAYSVMQTAKNFIYSDMKSAPSTYALFFALVFVLYALYLRRKASFLNLASIIITATAGLVWIFGIAVK